VDRPHRYAFLDLYRGLIVVFMLEGHLVRQLMGIAWQEGPIFRAHEFVHGLTAPGFLFGAGFTFAIATQRKAHVLSAWSWPFLRRMWRAVLLILIGYALHLPFFSLVKSYNEADHAQWASFLQFDVLQLIGVSLILLRSLYLVTRYDRQFLALITSIGLSVVLLTPSVWNGETVRGGLTWWSTAVSGWYGSPFPVFPNLAFVLAGVVSSWGFLQARQADAERLYMQRLFLAGGAMVAGGWLLDLAPMGFTERVDFWTTAPSFFWMRLGLLLMGMGALWLLENSVVGRPAERMVMPRWLTTLGIESLFVYIVHLLLLYGSVLNPSMNMSVWLGRNMSPLEAGVWVVPFVVVSVLAARWWHRLKKRHGPWMQMAYWWMGLSVAGELVLRAY
jgi:hypothetical protein